jgi:hypothetical protein
VQAYTRRDYRNEIKHLQSSTASWYLAIFRGNNGLEEQVCSSISSEASSHSEDDSPESSSVDAQGVRFRECRLVWLAPLVLTVCWLLIRAPL